MTTQPDLPPDPQTVHVLFEEHPARGGGENTAPWNASPNRLLTVEQAAEFLNLSRSRVYELINGQALQSVAIGRSRRVPLRALNDFVTGLLDGPDRHTQAPG